MLEEATAAAQAMVDEQESEQEQSTPPSSPATPTAPAEPPASRRFDTLMQWVDRVYLPLAAAPRLPWCDRWWEHPDAYERLHWLWLSWESSMVAQIEDGRVMSNWLLQHFDGQRRVIQGRDGIFANCISGHQQIANYLPPTDLSRSATGDHVYNAWPQMEARHRLARDDAHRFNNAAPSREDAQ